MKYTNSVSVMLFKIMAASAFALSLAACGGGGSGSGGSGGGGGSPAPVPTPPAPITKNPLDPITGNPATGNPTTSVSGVIYSAPTGSVVTAYNVQPDGSNGSSLGTAPATGSDGKFAMTLNATPSGMVRFVATGGTFTSPVDGTKQPISTMELITPYITSDLNSFVITPATHIASHAFAYQAKNGSTLTTAFSTAMNAVRSLGDPNIVLRDDPRAIVNMLKTLPYSGSDALFAYQDLLNGLEWFGVSYDLPSKVVMRVAASSAENNFPVSNLNGNGGAINVGKWVGGKFDETVTYDLDQVMATASPGFPDIFKLYITTNVIRNFYFDAACKDVSARQALYDRYPNMIDIFNQPYVSAFCSGLVIQMSELKAKITTNNRTLYMK